MARPDEYFAPTPYGPGAGWTPTDLEFGDVSSTPGIAQQVAPTQYGPGAGWTPIPGEPAPSSQRPTDNPLMDVGGPQPMPDIGGGLYTNSPTPAGPGGSPGGLPADPWNLGGGYAQAVQSNQWLQDLKAAADALATRTQEDSSMGLGPGWWGEYFKGTPWGQSGDFSMGPTSASVAQTSGLGSVLTPQELARRRRTVGMAF